MRVSQGKPRPSLPRADELSAITAGSRSEDRGPAGRFRAGNQAAIGNRARGVIKRCLGESFAGDTERQVSKDAHRMMRELLSPFPSATAQLRMAAAMVGVHFALAGFFMARALELGIESEVGEKLLERHDAQSKRHERFLVTFGALAAQMTKRAPRGFAARVRALERPQASQGPRTVIVAPAASQAPVWPSNGDGPEQGTFEQEPSNGGEP